MIIKEHTHISIKGKDLISRYGVYVILIKDDKTTYCYVGQTGDAKYISARSPFYRMASHLSYGKSTQNQVFKGLSCQLKIQNKETRIERQQMEHWFADKTLDIHFYKTDDFEFLIDIDSNRKKHLEKRRKTLELETAIIQELKFHSDITLLNKNGITYKTFKDVIPRAKEIINDLYNNYL